VPFKTVLTPQKDGLHPVLILQTTHRAMIVNMAKCVFADKPPLENASDFLHVLAGG
jgi:hypothetical protein